jgi:hypothetical protein
MNTARCSRPSRLVDQHEFARMSYAERETSCHTWTPSQNQISISRSIWSRVPSSFHLSTCLIATYSDRAHGWYVVRTTCTISGYNDGVGSPHVNPARHITGRFLALPSWVTRTSSRPPVYGPRCTAGIQYGNVFRPVLGSFTHLSRLAAWM